MIILSTIQLEARLPCFTIMSQHVLMQYIICSHGTWKNNTFSNPSFLTDSCHKCALP